MIRATEFITQASQRGFSVYSGVPCSYLTPFINAVIDHDQLDYIAAANEGDAVAIATGAQIGGRRAVALFQNSGLGNAVNPLTSLNAILEVPILLIVTLRGQPNGPKDEPQHKLMGRITTQLIDLMEIPWEYFPSVEQDISQALDRAEAQMQAGRCYALVMLKGTVESYALQSFPQTRPLAAAPSPQIAWPSQRPTRRQVLAAIQQDIRPNDILIASTGFIGRALYALGDLPNQLYMVGSMGCASSLGLGLALACPHHRIIVLEGDGAILMRMGALSAIGYQRPNNLLHVLIDNEVHDSTGGQSTVSHSVDLAAVAHACGYPTIHRPTSVEQLAQIFRSWEQDLSFLHIKTAPGEAKDLPRPTLTPAQNAQRLQQWIQSSPTKLG
jgi:phosphonopyruvate decarboxylase